MLHAFVLQYLKKSSTCDDGNLTLLVRELITAHILAKNKALDVNALQDCLEGLNPQAAGPGFKSPRMPDILSDTSGKPYFSSLSMQIICNECIYLRKACASIFNNSCIFREPFRAHVVVSVDFCAHEPVPPDLGVSLDFPQVLTS
jgi:hypothetical protein